MSLNLDFNEMISRYGTNCVKWDMFKRDVIPMWVADMDFPAPQSVTDVLRERLDHPIFGYTFDIPQLREVICQRLADLYDWQVGPHELVLIPGVVAAFNTAIRANAILAGNVLIQPPIYMPMLNAHGGVGQQIKHAPLTLIEDDGRLHYSIDFDAFEAAIDVNTRTFLMCNPHNPVGRVWTRDELTRMAAICEKHDVMICSDEIHCDLVFDGHSHTPIAALSPEISQRTITLMAPSKTFNIPSLGFSFAIIQNAALRGRFQQAEGGVVPHVGVLGLTAALGAYSGGAAWLAETMTYLQANRDLLVDFVDKHLPDVQVNCPEGTYLAWLDLRAYHTHGDTVQRGEGLLDEIPEEFFGFLAQGIEPYTLRHAKVALNNGAAFGPGGAGFARLNFATPRPILLEALDRLQAALTK